MKESVKIDPLVLASQVEQGMKKNTLAEYYGLNMAQMGNALKAQGLKIRKFHAPAFEFVTNSIAIEEISNTTSEEINVEIQEEIEEEAVRSQWAN